jgi:hypothetical protein
MCSDTGFLMLLPLTVANSFCKGRCFLLGSGNDWAHEVIVRVPVWWFAACPCGTMEPLW